MDPGTEVEDAMHQQQSAYAQQLQVNDIRLQAEEGPFEDLEFYYNQARDVFESWEDSPPSEEEVLFRQLQEQYESVKAKQRPPEGLDLEDVLNGSKRRRGSSSPMFVQQDGPGHDAESESISSLTGSKRKRGETSENSSKSSKPVPMTESVKQSFRRLVADAPPQKRQLAVQDCARVHHALKQFRPGSVKYLGEGTWNVDGIITPIKTHQLIHAGWMNEREASSGGPKGGILADKMGLGKTLCSLTSMVHGEASVGPRSSKTNLVVVPKALKDQWVNEARKHTVQPASDDMLGLNHILSYSSEPSSDTQMLLFKTTDLVIVTYTELSSAFKNVRYPPQMKDEEERELYFNTIIRPTLPAIFQFKFRAIYLDEGHLIRNVKTIWTMACQKLLSKFRWILTGTPMTNDPTDLYSVLTFVRHPKVLGLDFKEFRARYKGGEKKEKNDLSDKTGRKGKRGKNVKNATKKLKDDKKPEINIEWVGTLLHESMRSWKYEDELFGQVLTNIPDPTIIDLTLDLSVPEKVIYSVVYNRLRELAGKKSNNEKDKEQDGNENDPQTAEAHKFFVASITVLRQMAGHVLLIRPDIFRYLTVEDMSEIDDRIRNPEIVERSEATGVLAGQPLAESKETSLDPHADDYLVALRDLQRGNTCVVCEQPPQDPRWTVCDHAYCYGCLTSEMHLAAEQGHTTQCRLCKLPVGQCTEEAEHEKNAKPRWLNKSGKVIPSAKSLAVVSQLKTWTDPLTGDPQAKVLVFTTFKDSHKLLGASFKEEGWVFNTLTSDQTPAERNESVSAFKTDPKISILLATSAIGGTGLNLMNAR